MLATNAGEQTLRAGKCAGYAAGSRDAHHPINRSAKPTRYLEIGTQGWTQILKRDCGTLDG